MKKAEITAFLSLIFILLVSFVGSVIDVTSLQIAKNYRRMAAEMAIECVFAEYQKELLERYDVFALDTGYESGTYSENLISKRMEYYGFVNSDNLIESIKFLSDEKGEGFYQQVMKYMEHKYGIDYINDALGKTDTWESQEEKIKDYQQEESENKDTLENIFSQSEADIPKENNPIAYVDGLKKNSILKLVMPEGEIISERKMNLQKMPSHRELNEGYGSFPDDESYGTGEKLLFGEYVLDHFSTVLDDSDGGMAYEVEYLLAGKESDRENLEKVAEQLLAFRFIPNYTYLQSSAEKIAQAEAFALALTAIMAVPGASQAVAQGILLAWAFGESLVDIRTLLKGNRVPLVKDAVSWQLSLSGLMKLGEDGDIYDGKDTKNGMGYEDYLRVLLFLEKKESLTMRSLDLIELNLREIQGLSFFKVDLCATKIQMKCRCSFRRGITYTFPVSFAYQ